MLVRTLIFCAVTAATITTCCGTSHGQRARLNLNDAFRFLGGGVSAGYHWRTPGPKANYYNPYSNHNSLLLTGAIPQGATCYLSRMRQPTTSVDSCAGVDYCNDSSCCPDTFPEAAPMMILDSAESSELETGSQSAPKATELPSVIDKSESTRTAPPDDNSFIPSQADFTVESAAHRPSLWPGLYDSEKVKVHSIPYPIQNRNRPR